MSSSCDLCTFPHEVALWFRVQSWLFRIDTLSTLHSIRRLYFIIRQAVWTGSLDYGYMQSAGRAGFLLLWRVFGITRATSTLSEYIWSFNKFTSLTCSLKRFMKCLIIRCNCLQHEVDCSSIAGRVNVASCIQFSVFILDRSSYFQVTYMELQVSADSSP